MQNLVIISSIVFLLGAFGSALVQRDRLMMELFAVAGIGAAGAVAGCIAILVTGHL